MKGEGKEIAPDRTSEVGWEKLETEYLSREHGIGAGRGPKRGRARDVIRGGGKNLTPPLSIREAMSINWRVKRMEEGGDGPQGGRISEWEEIEES